MFCQDSDNGATDEYGDSCASWYYDHPEDCGTYDDNDFTAMTMCCSCKRNGILEFIFKFLSLHTK